MTQRGEVPASIIVVRRHLEPSPGPSRAAGAPSPDDEATARIRAHRRVVARRLVDCGLSRTALEAMLPGWSRLLP